MSYFIIQATKTIGQALLEIEIMLHNFININETILHSVPAFNVDIHGIILFTQQKRSARVTSELI